MARAFTYTKLSLDEFALLLGINPLHFNQVYVPDLMPARVCGSPTLQYTWQSVDGISREEIAQAIYDAEDRMEQALGFSLLPVWEVDDQVSVTRPRAPELYSIYSRDIRGRSSTVKTGKGYVQYGGVSGKSVILAGAAIVYSDGDGDGYFETATVTVPTSVTDPNEIIICYPGHSGEDVWEIRPSSISIAGGNAVIVVPRERLVLEDLLETLVPQGVNGLDNGNFLVTLDVYRKYNDPSQQVTFVWEYNEGGCSCGLLTCSSCTLATQTGCLVVRDERVGLISPRPGLWNATDEAYDSVSFSECRSPDYVRLYYRAGWRNKRLARSFMEMDRMWAMAVARYATSLLDRPICQCDGVKVVSEHWQADLALAISSPSGSNSYRVSQKTFDNPLGTSRGALFAWNTVKRYSLGEGMEDA